jgi:hypothetical protein
MYNPLTDKIDDFIVTERNECSYNLKIHPYKDQRKIFKLYKDDETVGQAYNNCLTLFAEHI